jgi:predicted glycosyltransferase
MRVHFDVGHPAHVHLFKNAVRSLSADGHEVAVTSREKEMTTTLLDAYGIEHTVLSERGSGTLATVAEWGLRELRTVRFARRFDPDVVVSRLIPTAVHAAKLSGAASVVFADTENVETVARATVPLIDHFCTPESYRHDYGSCHRRHPGVQELAYLHPDRFSPDRETLREHGVDPDGPYFVLRFAALDAHHDGERRGLPAETKRELVAELSERGAVYVSSEDGLPPGLDGHEVPVPPEWIHDLLAEADVLATDSVTMASEAGLLGTPAVRYEAPAVEGVLGALVELEDRGLVELTTDEAGLRRHSLALADDGDAGAQWSERRDRYLEESIDVTGYVLDVVEEAARE